MTQVAIKHSRRLREMPDERAGKYERPVKGKLCGGQTAGRVAM